MADGATVHVVHPGRGADNGGIWQCATYLLCGPQGAVLIDPGTGVYQDEVVAGIARAGCSLEDVGAILLTHCHVDHALGAYRLRAPHRPLIATPQTAEILRVGGHQVWYEYPEYVIPTMVDRTFADGEVLHFCGLEILALYTPGHTDDSASYLVRTDEGLAVFTGDLICGNGELGFSGSEGFSVEKTLHSLEKLLGHAPCRGFWGHGSVQQPASQWLQESLHRGRTGGWKPDRAFHPDVLPPPCLPRRVPNC